VINYNYVVTISVRDSSPATVFLESCEDIFHVQHVQNPARSRGNKYPSFLDLVFTSDPEAIVNITHLAPVSCSDHDWLLWNYKCFYQPPIQTSVKYSRNYFKENYKEFNNYFKPFVCWPNADW